MTVKSASQWDPVFVCRFAGVSLGQPAPFVFPNYHVSLGYYWP